MQLDKRCYWKKDDPLTWYKARNACLNEGGDLASFEKLKEKALSVSLRYLGFNESKDYWVGIYKGVWRWDDEDIGITYTCFNNSRLKTARIKTYFLTAPKWPCREDLAIT